MSRHFQRRDVSPGGNSSTSSESHGHPASPSYMAANTSAERMRLQVHGQEGGGGAPRSASLVPPGSASSRPAPIGGQRNDGAPLNGDSRNGLDTFSSSYTSPSPWSNEIPQTAGLLSASGSSMTGPTPTSRTPLSRHLSLTGAVPRTSTSSNRGEYPQHQQGWPDSPLSGAGGGSPLPPPNDFREGRSRTRPFAVSSAGHNNGHEHFSRSLSIASSPGAVERERTAVGAGIAASNMSPFMRDAGQLQPGQNSPLGSVIGINPPSTSNPNIYSASYSTSSDFYMRNRRPSSNLAGGSMLGAVGSGRSVSRRREAFWDDERGRGDDSLGLDGDIEENEDEEDEEDYAPPTRSGATSRRHSVATFALTPSAAISPPAISSQFGFNLPSSTTMSSASSTQQKGFVDHSSSFFGSSSVGAGSSRLDDEDLLATDLSNALQLNLDKQAQSSQAGFPQHLPSPRIPDSRAISLPVQSTFPRDQQQGTSPSAPHQGSPYGSVGSARPSGPGFSSSAANDFGPASPPIGSGRMQAVRATSTSGNDRYSSSARFGAQPNQTSPSFGAQQLGYRSPAGAGNTAKLETAQDGLWPPPEANVFSQSSPHFRSGTLPPPESLQQHQQQVQPQYNQGPTQVQLGFAPGQPGRPVGAASQQQGYGYGFAAPQQLDASRQRSPGMQMPLMGRGGGSIKSPATIGGAGPGMMPPFAGFGGMGSLPGQPTQNVHPLNVNAFPHMPPSQPHHAPPPVGAGYYAAPIAPQPSLNDLGRGVPLHALPSGGPLYIVEFKAGRTDLFYVDELEHQQLSKGELVVVEADRGKDLGKILTSCTLDEVREFQISQVESALGQLVAANTGSAGTTIGGIGTLASMQHLAPATPTSGTSQLPSAVSPNNPSTSPSAQNAPQPSPSAATIARMTKEIHPKKIYGRASPADVSLLLIKAQDENKALNVCRAKVLQHNLPMEVTDAEFQFDRRRLTFYYVSTTRIDFRMLVRDLFRHFKTRIMLVAR